MQDRRRATWVAVFLAAFATAHLMQYGLTVGRTFPGFAAPGPVDDHPALPADPEAASLAPVVIAGPALPPAAALPDRARPEAAGVFGLPCDRALLAEADPGALIRLRLTAPCDAGARVEVAHAGLRFAVRASALGAVDVTIPALDPAGMATLRLADGTVLSARAEVPEARGVARVAVSAPGSAGVSLLPPASGGAPATRLGDPDLADPVLAEVHEAAGGARRYVAADPPRIVAEVTAANCGRDVRVDVVRTLWAAPPEVATVVFAMPDCRAAGDLLLLPLAPDDLRIARN